MTAPVDQHARTARRSAIVAGGTALSRLTGLIRILAIGAVLGPTFFANIFQAGYALPGLVFTAIAGPTVSMVLVPVLVRRLAHDPEGARRILAAVSGRLLLLSGAAVLLLMVNSALIAYTLTLGVDTSDGRARALATTIVLLVAPQIVLYVLIALAVAAQQACGRFTLATTAPAVENLVMTAVVLIAGGYYGTGHEVDAVPMELAVALGVTGLAATGLHALVQLFGARRAGLPVGVTFRRDADPGTQDVLRQLRRSVSVAACPAVAFYGVLVLAATVHGGVFVVQVAWTAFNAGLSVGGGAVAVAALPALAASATSRDLEAFRSGWHTCLRYASSAAAPLSLLLVVGAWPAANLLTPADLHASWIVTTLAVSLVIVAGTQLVGVVHDLANHAMFALGDPRSPARSGQALLVATLLGGAVAMLWPADGTRLIGLVAAMFLGECAGAVVILVALRRRFGTAPLVRRDDLRPLRRALLAMLPGAFGIAIVGVLVPLPWQYLALLPVLAWAVYGYVTVLRRAAPAQPREVREVRGTPEIPATRETPTTREARERSGTTALSLSAVLLATVTGAVLGLRPQWLAPSVGVLVALAVVALCARTPMYGLLIYLASLPILAGIERGHLIPLLRPNEAVLVLVVGGALTGGTWRWLRGARHRLRWTVWDGACAVLAACAVVWPLTWMLLRGHSPEPIELAALLPVCKVLGLYVFTRATVRTPADIARCLHTVLWSGAVVAAIAVLQTLHVGPVLTVLGSAWALDVDAENIASRGSSTLGSPIATGDFLILCGLLLVHASRRGGVSRRTRLVLGSTIGAGILACGQISTWIACIVVGALLMRQIDHRQGFRASRVIPAVVVIGLIGAPAVAGRMQEFAQGQWPTSWLGRWDNLSNFYLPHLDPSALAFGISPNSVTPAPETWRDVIYLESGYLDLLWIGGTPLLLGFAVLSWTVLRRAGRDAADLGPRGVCAQTLATWWPALLVLMVLDPHLTLRGPGDLMFVLMAVVAGPLLLPVTRTPVLPAPRTPGSVSRRALDLTVSSFALVLLAPVMLAIGVAVRVTSPGPAVFRQERVGKDLRPFPMLKFRTMRVDADEADAALRDLIARELGGEDTTVDGSTKLAADPRITSLGRFLRRTSLDELPQLLNVLAGHMSLVGPRPCLPWEAAMFPAEYACRFQVRPGMTGLWQVSGRSHLSTLQMLALDAEYVQDRRLRTDLKILARTLPAALDGGSR